MVSLEGLLLKIISELKTSAFLEACEKAGLNEFDIQFILRELEEVGA